MLFLGFFFSKFSRTLLANSRLRRKIRTFGAQGDTVSFGSGSASGINNVLGMMHRMGNDIFIVHDDERMLKTILIAWIDAFLMQFVQTSNI